MAECNVYKEACGLTGTHIYINPYLPTELLGTEFFIKDYDLGLMTLGNGDVIRFKPQELTSSPQFDDELYFSYMRYEPSPMPVPEPPIVGLILVVYLGYWFLRR